MPVDPVAAVAAGSAAVGAARTRRSRRAGNASNVVLLTEAKPRRWDGYRMVCEVQNKSSVGISEVAITLKVRIGKLELDGVVSKKSTVFSQRAIAGGESHTLEFPHVVRFGLGSFDIDSDQGSGYAATLYWRDEAGKRWRRTNGDRAKACRARDFPSPRC